MESNFENMREGEDLRTQKIAFNYLVLRNIFRHLDYRDLKELRFVCKFWNSVLAPILSSQSYAVLDNSKKLQEYVLSVCNVESDPENFDFDESYIAHVKICDINYMEDDLRNLEIFWNYSSTDLLTGLEIDLAPHNGNSILTMLLATRVFPCLARLKIRILKFYDVCTRFGEENEVLGLAKGKCGCNFPRLFSFNYTYYSFDGSEYVIPIKWERVLQQLPNVQELLFTGVSPTELHEIMDAIWILKCTHSANYQIKKFQVLSEDILPETPDNAHLKKLTDLSLPLKSLHLEISPSIDEFVLESLLTKYVNSLEELQLRKYPTPVYVVNQETNELTDVIFSGLRNLEKLDISDNFLPSLDFLVHLPSLKSLTLSNRNPSKLSETKMILNTSMNIVEPFYCMTSLKIDENVSMSCFKRICTLFPLLQHLTLRMDDEMLRILFCNLPELKSLHIISKVTDDDDDDGSGIYSRAKKPTCSDKGITGIPIRFMSWGNVNIKKNRMFPYIGYLQHLENLTIEMWGNYGVGVTNLSIYYGLIELPRLKKVNLVRTLVTEDGVDLLLANGVKAIVID